MLSLPASASSTPIGSFETVRVPPLSSSPLDDKAYTYVELYDTLGHQIDFDEENPNGITRGGGTIAQRERLWREQFPALSPSSVGKAARTGRSHWMGPL